MAGKRRILALGAVLGVSLVGCAEEPSFRVRWRIAEPRVPDVPAEEQPDPADAPALDSPLGCTQVGINEIRLEAYVVEEGADGQEEEVLVGRRTRPCFPSSFSDLEATARGFPLPPGEYRIKLRGVRRDGAEWSTPGGQEAETATFVFDGVEIEEDKTIRLMDGDVDPVIPAPPQCEDGVDNDADGFVDASDPSCQAVGADLEGSQVFPHQFQLRVSFLNGNPNIVTTAHCEALGVRKIRVYDPNNPGHCLAKAGTTDDNDCLAVTTCKDAISHNTFFSATISELDEIAVVATDVRPMSIVPSPPAVDSPPPIPGVPVTRAKMVPISQTGSTVIDVDFADSDFGEPIVAPSEVLYRLFPGHESLCQRPAPQLGVTITDFIFTATDAHDAPIEPPIEMAPPNAGALDGTTLVPCASAVLTTEQLVWGGYNLRGEALSAEGEVCFEYTEPYPLAPGTGVGFADSGGLMVFQRVLPPPPSCEECTSDADCGTIRCDTDNKICVECLDDTDCAGQVCRDSVCEST